MGVLKTPTYFFCNTFFIFLGKGVWSPKKIFQNHYRISGFIPRRVEHHQLSRQMNRQSKRHHSTLYLQCIYNIYTNIVLLKTVFNKILLHVSVPSSNGWQMSVWSFPPSHHQTFWQSPLIKIINYLIIQILDY